MHHFIVTVDAKTLINATLSDGFLTMLDRISAHRGPTEQERTQPNIEDKHKVGVAVRATHAVVGPNAVAFVTIDTLVADVAVLSSWSLYNFTVRAEVFARDFSKYVYPAKVRVRLQVTWLIARHVAK